MKYKLKKGIAGLLAAALCLSLITSCTSTEGNGKTDVTDAEGLNKTGAVEKTDAENQNETEAANNNAANPTDPTVTGVSVKTVGNFTTQDVYKNTVTQDIFKENELTMVNVFATWCSPCVAEMPDLEKLHQQMKDKNVGVVGVVLDVLNENGEIVEEDLERAQLLVEQTGVTYPVLIPDSSYFNGRLIGIEALPETFFVDKNGNIVGEHYSGSGGLEDWIEVVETELARLKGGE